VALWLFPVYSDWGDSAAIQPLLRLSNQFISASRCVNQIDT